jgi:hypothetical protein
MEQLLDLYTDYLLSSIGSTTATGLSRLLEGDLSHDKISRLLSGHGFTSKDLWQQVKSLVRSQETEDACLIFDDTIIGKPYMDGNDIICWHWDHSKGRNEKGINLLTAFYHNQAIHTSEALRIPLSYECVKKTIRYCEIKTRKEKRQSSVSKNEMMRSMISKAVEKQHLVFKYVLADSWFSSSDNLLFIHQLKKYLASNNLELSTEEFKTLYKKRWSVEKYHKSLKQNASLSKSPARTVTTQSNHLFASLPAYVKLEKLKFAHKLNHFALKAKIYSPASKAVWNEFYNIKYAVGA